MTLEPGQAPTTETTPQAGTTSSVAPGHPAYVTPTQTQDDTSAQAAEKTYSEKYVQQLRSEAANNRVKAKELEERLASLEEAGKSEQQRLSEKAAKADSYEPELKKLRETLAAEVEARKATLPEAMRDLIPQGDAASQLDWIRKAAQAAEKLNPQPLPLQPLRLPAAGGRQPAGGADKNNDDLSIQNALATYPSLRRRQIRP